MVQLSDNSLSVIDPLSRTLYPLWRVKTQIMLENSDLLEIVNGVEGSSDETFDSGAVSQFSRRDRKAYNLILEQLHENDVAYILANPTIQTSSRGLWNHLFSRYGDIKPLEITQAWANFYSCGSDLKDPDLMVNFRAAASMLKEAGQATNTVHCIAFVASKLPSSHHFLKQKILQDELTINLEEALTYLEQAARILVYNGSANNLRVNLDSSESKPTFIVDAPGIDGGSQRSISENLTASGRSTMKFSVGTKEVTATSLSSSGSSSSHPGSTFRTMKLQEVPKESSLLNDPNPTDILPETPSLDGVKNATTNYEGRGLISNSGKMPSAKMSQAVPLLQKSILHKTMTSSRNSDRNNAFPSLGNPRDAKSRASHGTTVPSAGPKGGITVRVSESLVQLKHEDISSCSSDSDTASSSSELQEEIVGSSCLVKHPSVQPRLRHPSEIRKLELSASEKDPGSFSMMRGHANSSRNKAPFAGHVGLDFKTSKGFSGNVCPRVNVPTVEPFALPSSVKSHSRDRYRYELQLKEPRLVFHCATLLADLAWYHSEHVVHKKPIPKAPQRPTRFTRSYLDLPPFERSTKEDLRAALQIKHPTLFIRTAASKPELEKLYREYINFFR